MAKLPEQPLMPETEWFTIITNMILDQAEIVRRLSIIQAHITNLCLSLNSAHGLTPDERNQFLSIQRELRDTVEEIGSSTTKACARVGERHDITPPGE